MITDTAAATSGATRAQDDENSDADVTATADDTGEDPVRARY